MDIANYWLIQPRDDSMKKKKNGQRKYLYGSLLFILQYPIKCSTTFYRFCHLWIHTLLQNLVDWDWSDYFRNLLPTFFWHLWDFNQSIKVFLNIQKNNCVTIWVNPDHLGLIKTAFFLPFCAKMYTKMHKMSTKLVHNRK